MKKIQISHLLRPHWLVLGIAFIGVIGQSLMDLLEPWPLKIVFDYVLGSKPMPDWLTGLVNSTTGHDKFAILNFAAIAVVATTLFLRTIQPGRSAFRKRTPRASSSR